MVPDSMWALLVVGSFGAVGAAMAAGTVAALLRYRRTGTFPGSDEPVELSTGRRISLALRIVIGLAVAVYAYVSLRNQGVI